jgi:hypothetical protein
MVLDGMGPGERRRQVRGVLEGSYCLEMELAILAGCFHQRWLPPERRLEIVPTIRDAGQSLGKIPFRFCPFCGRSISEVGSQAHRGGRDD